MIQFNLLPDVKLQFIKAQRTRRLLTTVSLLVSLASIILLVVLLSVDGLQKKHLNDLNRDIGNETTTLENKPNINSVLTVQNQLESLTNLHNGKPAAARLFTYLNELTPASVGISTFSIDFTQYSMIITGTSDTLASVNQFIDTLKLTNYQVLGNNSSLSPAFSDVVLTSFGYDTSNSQSNQDATYTINLSYDKTIFDITQNIALKVPTTTTRAQLQLPSDVFSAPVATNSSSSSASNSGGQ
jgi:hypothetical protein